MTTAQRFTIAAGDAGTAQTVRHISDLICSNIADPIVRSAATSIVGALQPNDALGQIYAIREFLSQRIRFLRDPAGVELLHTPQWMLQQIAQQGAAHVDCDDVAILGGALAGSVGMLVRLVTVAFLDNDAPLTHIWASVSPPFPCLDDEQQQIWIELDTTRQAQAIPVNQISRSVITSVLE